VEQIESQSLRFGYANLGKRKAQRVLAPIFLAQIVLRQEEERQGYMFAVAATEKAYLPLDHYGDDALPGPSRPAAARARRNDS
jgi:hypothetical protein